MERNNPSRSSAPTNAELLFWEEQKEANRLAKEKLEVDRLSIGVAEKMVHTQKIYAISTAIAAIAAIIAAIAGIANFIMATNK